jgi:hypothetical protein
MKLEKTSILKDERTDCYSIMSEMSISDYLNLIQDIYKDKGGIKGQREPLKSSSAMRIRKQMVKDIKANTILPPIVLGLVVKNEDFQHVNDISLENLTELINNVESGNLTIIDGMQRTTALNEAIEDGASKDIKVRIEFWIARKLNSLIYRMLVLNTGQVPWNLRRQIETVFSSMINEMNDAVPEMEVYSIDDANRRSQGGQYHANDLIELYLSFGGRKEKVDTKERLADEFTRLDFIEATENTDFSDNFYSALKRLALLDISISRYNSEESDSRFSNGKDLFKSQPARVGLIAAIAKRIYGRPGFDKPHEEIIKSSEAVYKTLDSIIKKVDSLEGAELGAFLSFDLLSEKLSIKSARVGDFEREYFNKAFEALLEEGDNIPSLSICWSAY